MSDQSEVPKADQAAPTGKIATAEAGSPAATKKKRPKRRPEPQEEVPVIGGRFLTAAGIILATTFIPLSPIGATLEPKEPPRTDISKWKTGARATVRITLVTADYNGLACAADKDFEGRHCANKSEKEPWPRDPNAPLDDNKQLIIQPYRTWLDNRLILVAGMWATPALAMRLHNEPPGNLLPEKLARFVSECEVRFVGEFDKPKLRWGSGSGWNADPNTPKVPVAIAESCQIIPEPSEPCPEGLICAILKNL
jgi:hypothetical protein